MGISSEQQSAYDKALAASTVRIQKASNGYVVKRMDGTFVFSDWEGAADCAKKFFDGDPTISKPRPR